MKKFSEIRDNLTAKQASSYSLIISIILALIGAVLLTIYMWPTYEGRAAIILSVLISFPLFLAFYLFFSYFIFKAYHKTWVEKHKTAKEKSISEYNLTTAAYTKVKYNYKKILKATSDKEMLEKLLTHSAYTFYVKLTDEEKIELIVKDKDENIIYTDRFNNFIYLQNYFEKVD